MMHDAKPVRQAPAWLAGAAVGALLLGAAGFVYWCFFAGSTDEYVLLDRSPGDGVFPAGDARWRVQAGDALLWVTQKDEKSPATIDFTYGRYTFLEPDQIKVLRTCWRIMADQAVAKELGITPEQMAKLKEIRAGARIKLDPPDNDKLAALWKARESTSNDDARADAENNLIRAAEEVGRKMADTVKQSAAHRAELAQNTLTPEQLRHYDQMGH